MGGNKLSVQWLVSNAGCRDKTHKTSQEETLYISKLLQFRQKAAFLLKKNFSISISIKILIAISNHILVTLSENGLGT